MTTQSATNGGRVPPARRIVLITGASTGIGLAMAQRLLPRKDLHLVLTARSSSLPRFKEVGMEEKLGLWLRELDITNSGDRERLVAEINQKLGGVDVLINNAGITFRSVVEHSTEEERLLQMAVNFLGPMALVRLVLPAMRDRRSGKILNVSSVGGMMAMPTMAVYNASKFALEGASEALYYEVRPWKVQVCLLQLGFIHSDAFLKVPYTALSCASAEDRDDPYHAHYTNMTRFIGKQMQRSWTRPEHVARRVERLIDRKRLPLRARMTSDAQLFNMMRRLVPAAIYHELLYRALPKIRTWGRAR